MLEKIAEILRNVIKWADAKSLIVIVDDQYGVRLDYQMGDKPDSPLDETLLFIIPTWEVRIGSPQPQPQEPAALRCLCHVNQQFRGGGTELVIFNEWAGNGHDLARYANMVIAAYMADRRFLDATQIPDDLANSMYDKIDWSHPGLSVSTDNGNAPAQ